MLRRLGNRQIFPIISVADKGLGEMCFPAGLHIHSFSLWKSSHIWRYKDMISQKVRIDTSISLIFLKVNKKCRPAGKRIISSRPSSAASEIIVEIYAGTCTYHLNKSLQGFVQRKLDKFEIK